MNNHNNFVKILAKLNSSISTQLKKNLNQFNFFFKKDKSLTKLNNFINNQLEKNLNKLNFLFKKDKWLALLSFKRIFIFNLALFVSLFLYLSVPHLYDNSKSVTNIKKKRKSLYKCTQCVPI